MNRIDSIFSDLRARGQRALMPFISGGHPVPGRTGDMLRAAQRGGASIVEVGIPFSDPVADGPVIAAAMHNALKAGVTPASVMQEVAEARANLSIGVVAMCSVSIALKMGGPGGFASRLRESGFDGMILPDVPVEEATPYLQAAKEAGLTASLLIAPTTPFKRAEVIANACTGFVYLLTRTGITGTTSETPDMGPRIERLRSVTQVPIACGFGISTPQHVAAVVQHADAAIVGSALVRRLTDAAGQGQDPVQVCETFVRELASGLQVIVQG